MMFVLSAMWKGKFARFLDFVIIEQVTEDESAYGDTLAQPGLEETPLDKVIHTD